MKNRFLKFLFCSLPLMSAISCNNNNSDNENKNNGDLKLTNDNFTLEFKLEDGNYVPYVLNNQNNEIVLFNKTPILLNIRTKSKGLIERYEETIYESGYQNAKLKDNKIVADSTIKTDNGSKFFIQDSFYQNSDKKMSFLIERNVEILEETESDAGYSTTFQMCDYNTKQPQEYDYFMPSIIYKNTENMLSGAIFSNVDLVGRMYVKETRTGLPMMYLRNKTNNYAFSLGHINIKIDVNGDIGGGVSGEINDHLQYGSIGSSYKDYRTLDFTYPCSEGPITYDAGATWAKRYFEVKKGNKSNYSLALLVENNQNYNDSMVNHYLEMYDLVNPSVKDLSIDQIYEDNMEIFKNEYKKFGTDKGIKYGGLPWSLTLPNAEVKQGYSSQMGFVGQQIPAAYQLYRYGLINNDVVTKEKGLRALNFWSGESIQSTYFPTVWWDPANSDSAGTRRNYPCFLRCMVDGMEGMLDAYIISKQYNEPKIQYLNAVKKFANNLVAKQNPNGSFCRAYNVDGTINRDTSDKRFQGDSELNTPIAIRFLAKMYELTDDIKFYNAVVKASEFCYEELYTKLGKYVGGTPDNPNTVDKEAAVYAMYAFKAAYMLTNEEKYLSALKHAAVCAMSWVYVYDFKVPSKVSSKAINTFENGGVIGFSMIATGHSSADNYAAYIYYELFNTYVLTGVETFKNLAYFIQNNTKLSNDYDGRMHFKYRALMPEATRVSDFDFASVGTWLPWSSVANIEPIVNMKKTYKESDVNKINKNIDELKNELIHYGVGGIK